jgi:RNA polymerase sigma factor (sigma-70 family)
MQALDDMALLREYAANNSEAAFAELVSRRVGFVYSAALRQVHDPHLAGEITQAVFIILAQKAGRISEKTILTGWLFRTTRFAALAQMRARAKRSLRTAIVEKELQMQTENSSVVPDEIWNQMSPLLDEALAALGENDRQAVLLRFFENKSLAEIGNALGAGEDTARKRVSRALEKLHRYFSKRGVNSTAETIAGTISANSVQAVPVALAKSVTAVAIAKGAAASGSTLTLIKGALNIMAWTKAKTAVVVGASVLLAAVTLTVIVLPAPDRLEAAVKAVKSFGGGLVRDSQGRVVKVHLIYARHDINDNPYGDSLNTNTSDAVSEWLPVFKDAQQLMMYRGQATDRAMRFVACMTNLTVLGITEPEFTDNGFKQLTNLVQLQEIYLPSSKLTDQSLSVLGHLSKLEKIDLQFANITDKGLEQLRPLTKLRVLHVEGTLVTTEGIRTLETVIPGLLVYDGKPGDNVK